MSTLVLEQASVRVGGRQLLDRVSLSLEPGQFLALVGPNGAGKTTLLRVALGLMRPTEGRVQLDGQEIHRMNPRERAGRIAWLPQHSVPSENIRAWELVAAARYRFGESHAASEGAARAALERVGASDFFQARVLELSGGERQRVLLASLLAQGARLALLDEPASHLDPAHQIETYRMLQELRDWGVGVLLVSHDINLLGHLGDPQRIDLLGLKAGREGFRVRLNDESIPRRLGELFGLEFRAIEHRGQRVLLPTGAAEKPYAPRTRAPEGG